MIGAGRRVNGSVSPLATVKYQLPVVLSVGGSLTASCALLINLLTSFHVASVNTHTHTHTHTHGGMRRKFYLFYFHVKPFLIGTSDVLFCSLWILWFSTSLNFHFFHVKSLTISSLQQVAVCWLLSFDVSGFPVWSARSLQSKFSPGSGPTLASLHQTHMSFISSSWSEQQQRNMWGV